MGKISCRARLHFYCQHRRIVFKRSLNLYFFALISFDLPSYGSELEEETQIHAQIFVVDVFTGRGVGGMCKWFVWGCLGVARNCVHISKTFWWPILKSTFSITNLNKKPCLKPVSSIISFIYNFSILASNFWKAVFMTVIVIVIK